MDMDMDMDIDIDIDIHTCVRVCLCMYVYIYIYSVLGWDQGTAPRKGANLTIQNRILTSSDRDIHKQNVLILTIKLLPPNHT